MKRDVWIVIKVEIAEDRYHIPRIIGRYETRHPAIKHFHHYRDEESFYDDWSVEKEFDSESMVRRAKAETEARIGTSVREIVKVKRKEIDTVFDPEE